MGALIVHLARGFALGILLWCMVAAAKADDLSVGWALMETAKVASQPSFTPFETESGCRVVEVTKRNEQGVLASCVPVLMFREQGCDNDR